MKIWNVIKTLSRGVFTVFLNHITNIDIYLHVAKIRYIFTYTCTFSVM